MEITLMTEEQIKNFRKELIQELKKELNIGSTEPKKYWRSAQVRELLNIKESTLQNLRIKNIIPAFKIEGTWFYDKQMVESAIEKYKTGGGHV